MKNEPLEVTLKVTALLEKIGIRYLIGGSLASTLYGMIRTTQDSDIVAEMRKEHIPHFISGLSEEFYLDHGMIENAVMQYASFNIIHRTTMFKVDVFITEPSPFIRSELDRVQRFTFSLGHDVSANFASAEDIILAKMKWYRSGNEISENQWRDILGVLKTRNDTLDLEYMRYWARELKVEDILERALSQV